MRKYRLDRRQKKKQRKIIFCSMIGMISLFSVGYSAFSSNFLISGKGTIVEQTITIEQLKENIVTSGDGLYKDTLEENRYVYKGENPNNYLSFNNELWRIMAIENDATIKIMRSEGMFDIPFDSRDSESSGRRLNDNNTYCRLFEYDKTYYGCNAWSSVNGNYTSGGISGTVTEDAELNIYLNTVFYENINNEDRNLITSHKFNKGSIKGIGITPGIGIDSIINDEKKDSWVGFIALPNLSDWYKASSNPECLTSTTEWFKMDDYKCLEGNYIQKYNAIIFLSPDNREGYTHNLICSSKTNGIAGCQASNKYEGQFPTLFITANITLAGEGTEDKPFKIH